VYNIDPCKSSLMDDYIMNIMMMKMNEVSLPLWLLP
jgi:hypothetical protein